MQGLIERAKELLADGTVAQVLGWRKGDMGYDPEPAYFYKEEDLQDFVYDAFCGANLSKYMIEASKLEGRTLVFLKPCDTYSFNQLIKEHRVDREKAYIIGVGCKGTLKPEKIREAGIKGIERVAVDGDTLKFETIYGEKELPFAERQALAAQNPAYGNIICRCEMISEGEIMDAIHRPLGARSLDGVKRRTRAGMGRCQAGFCSPRTMEILEREVPMSMFDITKNGVGGNIVIGINKEI